NRGHYFETYSTPFRRVVNVRRHYWCPVGVHNDVKGLLRRAFVRTFDSQRRLSCEGVKKCFIDTSCRQA
ncbi:MAG: hypothetical protein RIS69_1109, partial [Actinomycetota bacterium]